VEQGKTSRSQKVKSDRTCVKFNEEQKRLNCTVKLRVVGWCEGRLDPAGE
jgi:hypothetical protein